MLLQLILCYIIAPIITIGTYIYFNNYKQKIYTNAIKVLSKYVKIQNITLLNNLICVKITGNKQQIELKCQQILKLKIACINYKLIKENNIYILYLYLKPYAINHINENKQQNSHNVVVIHI